MIITPTAKDIEVSIAHNFDYRTNLIIPNISWGFGIHECDVLMVTKAGYLTEFEIKVSPQDLLKDRDKKHGHVDTRIKNFYFAMPDTEKMLEVISEIPQRAGILVFEYRTAKSMKMTKIREPKVNTSAVPISDKDRMLLLRLAALRIWPLKSKIIDLKEKMKHANARHEERV